MIAYHWLKEDMHAGSGDEPAWKLGEERTHAAKTLSLCERGYHSSPTLFDALEYAPGPIACIVEISEPEARDSDKFVSRTRKLLAFANVEKELRQFACDCAERALQRERDAGREPDARSWAAIEASRAFLRGEITPEELDTASAAAWAASAAAWDAAWDATRAAAWAAARAALAPAWAPAKDAERAWQRSHFDAVVLPALLQAQEGARK